VSPNKPLERPGMNALRPAEPAKRRPLSADPLSRQSQCRDSEWCSKVRQFFCWMWNRRRSIGSASIRHDGSKPHQRTKLDPSPVDCLEEFARTGTKNPPEQPIQVAVEELVEVSWFEAVRRGPGRGFTFYTDAIS